MPANPVRGAVDSLANSRGRSAQHILIGLGLTVGAVAISALVARLNAPPEDDYEAYSDYDEPVVVEVAAAVEGVRHRLAAAVHGADAVGPAHLECAEERGAHPGADAVGHGAGAERGLDGARAQAAGRPARRGHRLARHGRRLRLARAPGGRRRPANLVAPYVGWIGFANVLSEGLWRRTAPEPQTLH